MLGGGHGWLQGQYGLLADNLISARLVLANGTAVTVSGQENSDLFWALRGAGHNFGIVTSFEYKIYDRTPQNENWALETFIFTGDQLEDIYGEVNKEMESEEPVELARWSMFFPIPDIDLNKVRVRVRFSEAFLVRWLTAVLARYHLQRSIPRHYSTIPIHQPPRCSRSRGSHQTHNRPPRHSSSRNALERQSSLPARHSLPRIPSQLCNLPRLRNEKNVRHLSIRAQEAQKLLDDL